ncbi:hypothetical protein KPB05_36495 [Burkholderia gladioli]|uniref:hypothetical protein n=1 Tax=Burkholderia gladioli TaxID=28095 RepID=UPI00285DC68F|nr:hypothetical protein [Burkholderia gladioli]MDR8092960.1 hypothetical protein [Burkholderia gladioli]
MKAHVNASKIVSWLLTHQSATVSQIAASGFMSAKDATDAFAYGVRHKVFERVRQASAGTYDRFAYKLTGKELPTLQPASIGPSFDALLAAWNIPAVPPRLEGCNTRKHELACEGEE